MSNVVNGRQLRAGRILAGLTQKDLAVALRVNERAIRFWERKFDRKPTGRPNDQRIEEVLHQRGVLFFSQPTPGVRFLEHDNLKR